MTARRLILALLPLLLLGGCGDETAPQRGAGPRIEGLILERLDGGAEAIEDYRGKLVVLNVWATWCPPCRREMPGLEKLARELDPERFAVIGLAIDESPPLVREYLRQKGLTFARHIDRGGNATHQRMDLSAVPTTVVIAPDGRVVWSVAGERDWGDPDVADWLRGLL